LFAFLTDCYCTIEKTTVERKKLSALCIVMLTYT